MTFLLAFMLLIPTLCLGAHADGYDSESDPFVSLSYVNEVLKPQIVAEILAQLKAQEEGSKVMLESVYADISLSCGRTIVMGPDCEFIYRGGGAAIITSSTETGKGVLDMSAENSGQTEFFSGKVLEKGHVYYSADSEAEKYILITGTTAYFTIRGRYEVR